MANDGVPARHYLTTPHVGRFGFGQDVVVVDFRARVELELNAGICPKRRVAFAKSNAVRPIVAVHKQCVCALGESISEFPTREFRRRRSSEDHRAGNR